MRRVVAVAGRVICSRASVISSSCAAWLPFTVTPEVGHEKGLRTGTTIHRPRQNNVLDRPRLPAPFSETLLWIWSKREARLIIMPTTLQEFESVWPRIRDDIASHAKSYDLPQQPLDWLTKVRTL